jgi:hypothetical protein
LYYTSPISSIRREDFALFVGQVIAFCGLSCLGEARQHDRRQEPIICPTLTTPFGYGLP